MSARERDEAPPRDLDEHQERRLHEIDPSQLVWAGCIGALLFACAWVGQVLLVFGLLIIGILGIVRYANGFGYSVVWARIKTLLQRLRRGQMLQPQAAEEAETKKPAKPAPKRTRRPPIPLKVMALQMPDEDYDLGVIHNVQTNADTIRASGRGWSGVALDLKDRFQAENLLTESVRQAVMQYDGTVGVSMTFASRPVNIERSRDWSLKNLHNSVIDVAPENYRNPSPGVEVLAANQAELDGIRQSRAHDVITTIGLTVPRPDSWPKDETQITHRQIEVAPIVNMARILEQGMGRSGVDGAEMMDFIDLKTYVRMTWNIAGIAEWYKRYANMAAAEVMSLGARAFEAELEANPAENSVEDDITWPWPEYELQRTSTYLLADGTYHRVLRVYRQRKRVMPGDFLELFTMNVGPAQETGLTITLSGQTVSAASEMKWLNRGIVWSEGIRQAKVNGRNLYESMEKREKRQRLIRRQDRLYLGGNYALAYNTYIVVSATSLEALDAAERVVRTHCRGVGVKVKTVTLEARQVEAFLTATLGVAML